LQFISAVKASKSARSDLTGDVMRKSRFTAGSGLGVRVALALAIGAAPGAGMATTKAQPTVEAAITAAEREEFRGGIRQAGETMTLLMDAFPEEYLALETKVILGVKSGQMDLAAVRKLSFEWASGLRTRVMANASKASDADLIAIGRRQQEIMRKLSGSNARACYEFMELGGLSQDSAAGLGAESRAEIDKLGAMQLRAASAATKNPIVREEVTEAEIKPLLTTFEKNGGDLRWLAAVGKPDQMDNFSADVRCANAEHWLATILEQPAAMSARLLAS
jgi:hypothetical protein